MQPPKRPRTVFEEVYDEIQAAHMQLQRASTTLQQCSDRIIQTLYPNSDVSSLPSTSGLSPLISMSQSVNSIIAASQPNPDIPADSEDHHETQSVSEIPERQIYPKVRSSRTDESYVEWVRRLCRTEPSDLIEEARNYRGFTTDIQPSREEEEGQYAKFYERSGRRTVRYFQYKIPAEVLEAKGENEPLPGYYTRWPIRFVLHLINGVSAMAIYDPHLQESIISPVVLRCKTKGVAEIVPYPDQSTHYYSIAFRYASPYKSRSSATVNLYVKSEGQGPVRVRCQADLTMRFHVIDAWREGKEFWLGANFGRQFINVIDEEKREVEFYNGHNIPVRVPFTIYIPSIKHIEQWALAERDEHDPNWEEERVEED